MALRLLQQAVTGSSSVLEASAYQTARALSSYTFSGLADAPPAAGSSNIKVDVSGDAKGVTATITTKKGSAKATSAANSIKKLQASPITLYEASRVSVLHASLMHYLLNLANQRYQILADFPDFTRMLGKDYYYRSHPEEVRKFYSQVDEFHRMYDVLTEFDSLSHLATQMLPGFRKRHMNVLGPAVTPTVANGVVTQFLLAKAQ